MIHIGRHNEVLTERASTLSLPLSFAHALAEKTEGVGWPSTVGALHFFGGPSFKEPAKFRVHVRFLPLLSETPTCYH